jgi:hypothetical protein
LGRAETTVGERRDSGDRLNDPQLPVRNLPRRPKHPVFSFNLAMVASTSFPHRKLLHSVNLSLPR